MSNYITLFYIDVIIYHCLIPYIYFSKKSPGQGASELLSQQNRSHLVIAEPQSQEYLALGTNSNFSAYWVQQVNWTLSKILYLPARGNMSDYWSIIIF